MFRQRDGLFATLEDATGQVIQVAEPQEVVPEVVAEVSEGTNDLHQDAQQVGQLVAQVEDAQIADGELQTIADTMQQSVDAGTGMNETSAQLAQIAVESICSRLSLRPARRIPAVECFGSSNSALSSTNIAIESIGSQIKQIWEGIKKFLAMVWQKITDFFSKFFANAEKLEQAAVTMKAQVKGVAGKTAKETTFEDGSLVKAFAVTSGDVNDKAAIAIIDKQEAMLKGVKESTKVAYDLVGKVVKIGANLNKGSDAEMKDLVATGEKMVKAGAFDGTKGESGSAGDAQTVTWGPFVGGETVTLALDVKGGYIEGFSASFGKVAKLSESKKCATLSESEMNGLLDKVVVLAKQATEFKKTVGEIKSVTDELNKATQNILSAINKGLGDREDAAEVKKQLEVAKAVVTGSATIISRTSTQAPVMAVKAGNAALKYVSASIKMYKEEEKAAA